MANHSGFTGQDFSGVMHLGAFPEHKIQIAGNPILGYIVQRTDTKGRITSCVTFRQAVDAARDLLTKKEVDYIHYAIAQCR